MLDSIAPYVGERLGYYVYLYVDPRTNEPFYVGKGQGDRALAHLCDTSESLKVARIKEIQALGLEPQIGTKRGRIYFCGRTYEMRPSSAQTILINAAEE